MKKTNLWNWLLSLVLCLCMVLGMMPGIPISVSAADDLTVTIDTGASVTLSDTDGDGYYEIGTADELYAFAALVSDAGEKRISGELTADIVVNEDVLNDDGSLNTGSFRSWKPIGNINRRFEGNLDGANHTISGLYLNDPSYELGAGLVGRAYHVVIKDIGIIDSYINGNENVGAVVGYADGSTISNCYNAGTVTGIQHVGGVVGQIYNGGTVSNCYNTAAVSGSIYAGGVVGYGFYQSLITNCYNTGAVSASQRYAGGIVAIATQSCTIRNCYNTAAVSGPKYVGGVIAYSAYSPAEYCYNFGTVNGTDRVGGVAGTTNSAITCCFYLDTCGSVVNYGTSATAEQFTSGEICHKLNGDQSNIVFYQTLGSQSLPLFTGERVYGGYSNCQSTQMIYSNSYLYPYLGHHYENGICTSLGCYEPAVLNDSGVYEIGNLGQLMWFAQNVNTAHKAILTADITIDNSVVWTPISLQDGTANSSTFNGGGHTITFANTNEGSTFGLFDSYNYSIIENLNLAGSISCNTTGNVGALINSAYRTTIRNVVSTCDITNSAASGGTGGLAGYFGGQDSGGLYSLIENCAVYADVIGGGSAGGLIGNMWGGYQYCTVRNSAYVGNVAGTVNSGAIVGANGNNASTTSTFNTVYFRETDGIGWIGSAGSGQPFLTNVEAKTTAQFAFGEVAYLLGAAWGQTIGTDAYPILGGEKVYQVIECNGQIVYYTNTGVTCEHTWVNGFCTNVLADGTTVCDAYQPAEMNADGYCEISNAGQLYWFAARVNGGLNALNAVLTADIVVNESTASDSNPRVWSPIGNGTTPFLGQFNGNGHTISGLYISSGRVDYVGLFGYLGAGSQVAQVGVVNPCLFGSDNIGGIAGVNEGSILNCFVDGGVNRAGTGSSIAGSHACGGIVGSNQNGNVDSCYAIIYAIAHGSGCDGGIAGYNNGGTVTNCYYMEKDTNVSGTVGGIDDKDVAGSAESKSAAQFASGEVVYLLGDAWGQTLNVQDRPVPGGAKVYQYTTCDGIIGYTNDEALNGTTVAHNSGENGFCTVCGAYEPAERNTDGYYEIGNAGQLFWFASQVNGGNSSINAVLTADIDLESRVWTAIASTDLFYATTEYADLGYQGIFDGNGHSVKNVSITGSAEADGSFGLFGTLSGTVKNLSIEGFTYTGAGMDSRVGAVAGQIIGGTVENCSAVNVSINTQINTENGVAGGIAGCSYAGIVQSCYSYNVTIKAGRYGGILGDNCADGNDGDGTDRPGTMTGCYTDFASYVGSYTGTETNCAVMSAQSFASGQVAYLLGTAWGQTIGTDAYPVLGGEKVYQVIECNGQIVYYTNTGVTCDHTWVNGFCTNVLADGTTVCDAYQPAEMNADGYCEISNAGQLYWFAARVNGGLNALNAVLTADIVVNESTASDSNPRVWTPIGNGTTPFLGQFNGGNHTVSGLYISNSNLDHLGLFGYLGAGSQVAQVGVVNSCFSGYSYIGGIAGVNEGSILNCYVCGDFAGSHVVAGIVGENIGSVTNCFMCGDVRGGGYIAILVGRNRGSVSNSYADLSLVFSYNRILISSNTGSVDEKTSFMNHEQFTGGEVAYLLGEGFGQTIGSQDHPVLGGAKVYQIIDCMGNSAFSNTDVSGEHIDTDSDGRCDVCDCVMESAKPVMKGKSFSLSFEDEIRVNFYYTVSDMTYVEEHGMLVFYSDPGTADFSKADAVYHKPMGDSVEAYYGISTAGIAAREMGDTRYYVAYAKLDDGSYVYSNIYGYSPKQYAMNMLGKTTTSDKQKVLCVALLNFGAAAQEYFGYQTDGLMNAGLTDEQKALVIPYDRNLFTGAMEADEAKIGAFAATATGFSDKGVTVSLEGAFSMNYYFTPDTAMSGDMTLYIWTPEAYAAADTLTADNASETVTMAVTSLDNYWGAVSGIAAKCIDDTYYVAGVYTDADGNTHCTGVIAYSVSQYCLNKAVDGCDMQQLAGATAMYGYYANKYFTA